MESEAAAILEDRRERWKSKGILRNLYSKWYRLIGRWVRRGRVLELGGGSGNLKEFFSDAVCTDVVFASWLDAVLDAHRLPFKDEILDSIVLFDVLHHLISPALFFQEAGRVLRPKGRIIMMEPYVSWSSFIIYQFFHQEGMNRNINPLETSFRGEGKEPFQGNQAVPGLIFRKYREDFLSKFSGFRIIRQETMDSILYPLSGGFHHPSLCPACLYQPLRWMEGLLTPLNRFIGFRMFIVIEKR